MDGQGAQEFVEPPRDQIPGISRMHVEAMESTDDDAAWVIAGMHHVVLTTTGRTSGRRHKVALPFWRDPDGHPIVVASFAGAPQHPAWFLNLQERPDVGVRVQGRSYDAHADVLEGDDYDRTWADLTGDRPWYNDYQTRTERRIPLVRLVGNEPA